MSFLRITNKMYKLYCILFTIFTVFIIIDIMCKNVYINILTIMPIALFLILTAYRYSQFIHVIVDDDIGNNLPESLSNDRIYCKNYFINTLTLDELSRRLIEVFVSSTIVLIVSGILLYSTFIHNGFKWIYLLAIAEYIAYVLLFKYFMIHMSLVCEWITNNDRGVII